MTKQTDTAPDFLISGLDFSATEITVAANSDAAKRYLAEQVGYGVASVNYRKSHAVQTLDRLLGRGFTFAPAKVTA